jgi:hypothetical protein
VPYFSTARRIQSYLRTQKHFYIFKIWFGSHCQRTLISRAKENGNYVVDESLWNGSRIYTEERVPIDNIID